MWVCLNDGFLSAVEHRDDKSLLTVRARQRHHLAKHFPKKIVHYSDHTDYPFRIFVSKSEFAEWLFDKALAIDYGNFKGSVKNDKLHSFYNKVWTAGLDLEENGKRGAYSGKQDWHLPMPEADQPLGPNEAWPLYADDPFVKAVASMPKVTEDQKDRERWERRTVPTYVERKKEAAPYADHADRFFSGKKGKQKKEARAGDKAAPFRKLHGTSGPVYCGTCDSHVTSRDAEYVCTYHRCPVARDRTAGA